jgi:hypothetical protein
MHVNKLSRAFMYCNIYQKDLRILDPSDTHNNFLALLYISSIPQFLQSSFYMFRVIITHHQELFYEQFVKLRVASQYALKIGCFTQL